MSYLFYVRIDHDAIVFSWYSVNIHHLKISGG